MRIGRDVEQSGQRRLGAVEPLSQAGKVELVVRAEQAAIEHARQETIRQLKRVRDSALRGLVAGALGFSLAFLIIFANKIEETYLLGYITVLRTVPGGLAGLLLQLH